MVRIRHCPDARCAAICDDVEPERARDSRFDCLRCWLALGYTLGWTMASRMAGGCCWWRESRRLALLGPLFVVATLAFVALLVGRSGLRAAVVPPRAPALISASLIVIAGGANLVWELTQQAHPGSGRSDVGPGLAEAWRALPNLGEQAIGVFGAALDVEMPLLFYLGWAAMLAVVVGAAVRLGDRRERLVLAGATAVILSSVFVLSIGVRPTGFPVQARHLLPLAVLVPIGAGEVMRRHAEGVSPASARNALLAAVGIAAVLHLAAWYGNADAWAGWSPPLSWFIWSVLLLISAAAILAAAWSARDAAETQERLPAGVEPHAVSHRVVLVRGEPVFRSEGHDPVGDPLEDAFPSGQVVHVGVAGGMAREPVLDPAGLAALGVDGRRWRGVGYDDVAVVRRLAGRARRRTTVRQCPSAS